MHLPQNEAEDRASEILATATVVFSVSILLWPPGAVYWSGFADAVGEAPTLAVVGLLALMAGLWFERLGGFGLLQIAVGSVIAYAVGIGAMELLLSPRSPAHLVWYGILVVAFLTGATLWRGAKRFCRRRART
jgi:hypothetical protein